MFVITTYYKPKSSAVSVFLAIRDKLKSTARFLRYLSMVKVVIKEGLRIQFVKFLTIFAKIYAGRRPDVLRRS